MRRRCFQDTMMNVLLVRGGVKATLIDVRIFYSYFAIFSPSHMVWGIGVERCAHRHSGTRCSVMCADCKTPSEANLCFWAIKIKLNWIDHLQGFCPWKRDYRHDVFTYRLCYVPHLYCATHPDFIFASRLLNPPIKGKQQQQHASVYIFQTVILEDVPSLASGHYCSGQCVRAYAHVIFISSEYKWCLDKQKKSSSQINLVWSRKKTGPEKKRRSQSLRFDLCLTSVMTLPFCHTRTKTQTHTHTHIDTHGLMVLLMLAHLLAASSALITVLSFPCKHQPTSPCIPMDRSTIQRQIKEEGEGKRRYCHFAPGNVAIPFLLAQLSLALFFTASQYQSEYSGILKSVPPCSFTMSSVFIFLDVENTFLETLVRLSCRRLDIDQAVIYYMIVMFLNKSCWIYDGIKEVPLSLNVYIQVQWTSAQNFSMAIKASSNMLKMSSFLNSCIL